MSSLEGVYDKVERNKTTHGNSHSTEHPRKRPHRDNSIRPVSCDIEKKLGFLRNARIHVDDVDYANE